LPGKHSKRALQEEKKEPDEVAIWFSLQQQTLTGLEEKTRADTLDGADDPTSLTSSEIEIRILTVQSL